LKWIVQTNTKKQKQQTWGERTVMIRSVLAVDKDGVLFRTTSPHIRSTRGYTLSAPKYFVYAVLGEVKCHPP